MQTTLTTSHWRTLQEMLLQKMERKTRQHVSVLLAGMPFIAQGVKAMLRDTPWVTQVDILAPQDEERFDVGAIEADVIFLTTPGTSRLLGRIAAHYQLLERSDMRVGAGYVRDAQSGHVTAGSMPRLYPGEVVAADLALRAANRERRRLIAERGAQIEGEGNDATPPGLAFMHISSAVSHDDIVISRKFGRPVSLHIRDGAKTVRTGIFATTQGLTYCSPHAFANHPELFVGYGLALTDEESMASEALRSGGPLPVADPALWQMLSDQDEEVPPA